MAHHFNKYQHKNSLKKTIYQKLKEKSKLAYDEIKRDKKASVYETLKKKAHSTNQDVINGDIKVETVNNQYADKKSLDDFEAEYQKFIEEQKALNLNVHKNVNTLNTKVEKLEVQVSENKINDLQETVTEISTKVNEIINKEEKVDQISEVVNEEVEEETPVDETSKEETTPKKAKKARKKKKEVDSVIDENSAVETAG